MSNTNNLTVGQVVCTNNAFTTPTGIHFASGSRFVVNLVGKSTRCIAEQCGSVVWISDGCFLSDDGAK